MTKRVTPDEDAILRRLHWFERFGAELSPAFRTLKAMIRQRDKRQEIRDPDDVGPPEGELPPA